MSHSRENLTVQLVGGLGNQLFGYHAGLAVAIERNLEVRYDVSQFNLGFSSHGSDIQSFELHNEFLEMHTVRRFLARAIGALKSEPLVPKFLRSILSQLFPEYTSVVDGFDSKVFECPSGSLIRGYFQSSLYLEKLKLSGNFKPLTLKNESDWYKAMLALLATEKPVSIHLRRGDYRALSAEFGLLSKTYYSEALELLSRNMGCAFNVWVFSDDPVAAKEELSEVLTSSEGVEAVRWIQPPLGHDPAESLLLMANASANIISNSTFAWWGAALNSGDRPVVAPKKWFRGKADPDLLYPIEWMQVDSAWVQ